MKCVNHRAAILQVALDMLSEEMAMQVAHAIFAQGDRVEIGTPLLLAAGLSACQQLRQHYPDAIVVADTKICDAGTRMAQASYRAGADVITVVSAAADHVTWHGARQAAEEAGETKRGRRLIMADLIGAEDPAEAARRSVGLGADELCLHLPKTLHSGRKEREQALDLISAVCSSVEVPVFVAGGLHLALVPEVISRGAGGVIVGRAIVEAPDPARTAQTFRRAVAVTGDHL